ncbi:hypothetical protein Adt_35410 [Abeliophyllum distichum]|uniref:Uncharacterized protein n=1 Tax=Abeliophyllum distichum TaxID=126358 RepID=A0ABD1QFJ6_9LAMI
MSVQNQSVTPTLLVRLVYGPQDVNVSGQLATRKEVCSGSSNTLCQLPDAQNHNSFHCFMEEGQPVTKGCPSLKAYETPKGRSNTIILPPPYPSASTTSSADRWFGTHAEVSPCRRSAETISTYPPHHLTPSIWENLSWGQIISPQDPSEHREEAGASNSRMYLNAVLYIPPRKASSFVGPRENKFNVFRDPIRLPQLRQIFLNHYQGHIHNCSSNYISPVGHRPLSNSGSRLWVSPRLYSHPRLG